MRLLGFLEYLLVFVGAVGMFVASGYHLPKGVHFGLFVVGAGITIGGLESIVTRGMSFRFTTLGIDDYAGTPALIWGWALLLVGATLIASAQLMDAGLWHTTVFYAMRRAGGLLVLMGLVVAAAGALIVFTPRTYGIAWTLLVRVPKTIVGLTLIITGIAAVGLGLWKTVDPLSFARVTAGTLAQFGLSPLDHYWRRMLAPLL